MDAKEKMDDCVYRDLHRNSYSIIPFYNLDPWSEACSVSGTVTDVHWCGIMGYRVFGGIECNTGLSARPNESTVPWQCFLRGRYNTHFWCGTPWAEVVLSNYVCIRDKVYYSPVYSSWTSGSQKYCICISYACYAGREGVISQWRHILRGRSDYCPPHRHIDLCHRIKCWFFYPNFTIINKFILYIFSSTFSMLYLSFSCWSISRHPTTKNFCCYKWFLKICLLSIFKI
jgi:hypothetical protein